MTSRRIPNLLAAVEEEILEEKSSPLVQNGKRLERALVELEALAERAQTADSAERARLALLHAELRREAKQQHWYLLIQREALGLRDHRLVDELYPIPPPLETEADDGSGAPGKDPASD